MSDPVALKKLPKDPGERVEVLMNHSMPGTRAWLPACLPDDAAEAIMAGRAARAVMYATAEDLNDRVRELGDNMRDLGVVMHLVDEEDETSWVKHMTDSERTAKAGTR